MKTYFEELTKKILNTRQSREHLLMSLSGESSQFIRVNGAKVRQSGVVEDTTLEITLLLEDQKSSLKRASKALTLTGLIWQDWDRVQSVLAELRQEVPELPVDPYASLPKDYGSIISETKGNLLSEKAATDKLLSGNAKNIDIAGIYSSGPLFRGMANSAGQNLWFSTEAFSFDYSVYTKNQKALKGTYAGREWNQSAYESELETAREHLKILEKPEKRVPRGSHRTYLAPAALSDLIGMMSWGCMSEASLQQGDSPLRTVRQGERSFSPLFSLSEDFSQGLVPRFNGLGEIAGDRLPLIHEGKLENTLISSRTAKEYGLKSNAAGSSETLRSPVVGVGSLEEKDILKKLDTGLYLSNLHYLNWSDQPGGRITGMTRYACFWVENGQIISPIENMRWDDSLFTLLGSELEAFTRTQSFIADVMSYERRALGGILVPGALVKKMTFTI